MKKQALRIMFLCGFLILCSYSTAMTAAVQQNTPDWPDGTFHGIWANKNQETSGSFWGSVNQGRRATRGTFSAEWNTSSGTEQGVCSGVFYGKIMLGTCKGTEEGKTTPLLGFLRLNDTHMTASVYSPGAGLITLNGVHDASFLPKPTGSSGIGIRSLHLVDSSRPEYFTPDPDDVREIMIQLWYPTEKNIQGTRAEYMDYPTFQWLKGRSPIPLVTIPNNAYLFVRPHGRNEPPIAEGMFPVVVFSPGYDGVYQIYSSFIEDLVSHGFVVVSINHPYVSGITVFPDGRTIGLAEVPADPVERSAFFNMSLRSIVQDAKFALDVITEMNQTDPEFSGHFDVSSVGMYGHSFGGANTATCCYEDARFRAGLTLDGVFYRDFIPGNITLPMFFMFAEARLVDDAMIQYLWNHTTNDTFRMSIAGSTHYAFTDVGVLLRHLVPVVPPRLLSFGSIAPKRMVNITRTYVTVFFEVYLKGEPVERLLDLSEQFDEVTVTYKFG